MRRLHASTAPIYLSMLPTVLPPLHSYAVVSASEQYHISNSQPNVETSRDRIMSVTILPNEGNRLHNCDVVGTGQCDFLVTYGPKPGANADDYRRCESCWCYLVLSVLE